MNCTTRRIRWALAIPAGFLLLALAATLVLAEESTLLNGKLRAGDTVTVPSTETVDGDLYAAAGTVTIDGTVDGDLIAAGGTIQVNGTVQGDVAIGGGTVSIFGPVGGDLRVGGGQVTVSGPVAEDVVVGGGQVTVGGGADIKGDLIVSGGTVSVAGNVAGSIEGTAGTYSRSGTVGGAEHVTISPQSGGAITPRTTGDIIFDAMRHFVVLVILGALMLWLLPRLLHRAERTLRGEPLLSLGGGVATFIGYVAFVIVLLLLVIVLAILFGLLSLGALVGIEVVTGVLTLFTSTFLFVVAVAFVADIVVGLTLARMVMRDPAAGANRWRELGLLAAGAATVVIVTSLPVIGGLAKLLVIVFGLGALAVAAWRWWRGPRTPDAVTVTPPTPEAPAAI